MFGWRGQISVDLAGEIQEKGHAQMLKIDLIQKLCQCENKLMRLLNKVHNLGC